MTKPTGKPHGVRYTKHQTDACREKIRTSAIIGRLQRHINGKLDMSPTQVRAAECLLSKTLPSLQSAEVTGDVVQYVARLPDVAPNAQAWLDQVKPMLTSTPVSPVLSHDHNGEDNQDITHSHQECDVSDGEGE
jgi:hypothetical protein